VQTEQRRAYEIGRLVRVKYIDHAIFLNASLRDVGPTVRESVGWLVEEGAEHLVILSDRRLDPPARANERERYSGVVLLKKLILKLEEVGP